MFKSIVTSVAAAALLGGSLQAAEVEVEVVNLMKGTYITPLLIAAHPEAERIFTVGTPASLSLQMVAEGGDISGVEADMQAAGADIVTDPAGGGLAPGAGTMTTLTTREGNTHLSVVAMLIPTNDGFIGFDDVKIPTEPGVYKFMVNGYDAGTEANDERFVEGAGAPGQPGIPGNPGGDLGTGGTGFDTQPEGYVHIHRGVLGDTNATGGPSDLDSRIHRWLNPVAAIIVTVK